MTDKRGVALAASLLLALGFGGAEAQTPVQPQRSVVLTFDDLPAVSTRSDLATWAGVTDGLVTKLVAAGVPAVGFVNEGKLYVAGALDHGRAALLERWVAAGLELGNHTYSHASLHRTPIEEYERDTARGDSVTTLLMAARGSRPRWSRHPQLHAGTDLDVKRRLDSFLAARGYRIAPVTIDNYDYLFARAWDIALDRGDSALAARTRNEYLTYMDTVFGFYQQQSQAILGYELPQILLLHANRLNAAVLDDLLAMMRRRGYRFITLEEAMRDPAYRRPDTYTGPAGITWLHRWALADGRRGSFFAGEPTVPAFVQALAGQR